MLVRIIMGVLDLIQSARPCNNSTVRRRIIGKTVIFCPNCATVRMAREEAIHELNWHGPKDVWVPKGGVYHCTYCSRDFPGDGFTDNGSGVLQPRDGVVNVNLGDGRGLM